ncbi:N-alpha-acetyltransferase 25, NatB auxiliary subunit-like isoform X1 [Vespa mandarinia]|uniref:N-alpha-acetyltransferase 25, NatB auxiliary subunit-like isoform X1 n=1 Tax=Vespa mandarinia TaxID=7446 RepID=UPI0016196B5F|nr:N-alpha-acetyltransferase 25, NatB auxiliary subunit-like isoform X1 [Vespa mandarinia]XP_035725726.1 N-alpha-acetyltransferase 25, NatB auxiliary subunit-like isoform X1 [Vespa mandarinia]XP_035725727.1 N-alpha-acetyltransferase 25, NatB auxiliary subunit-like isoform X1 [Vespa mandarinia]XP_046820850.1 N-alpha-acetyltransferase 25, NatB auxiliary subunit isoform X1 [Vespa crabro]XP_046820851.1 N-alpha-acetyltransferase 25, NatB auxiliary subunit isoform X1 [Vespa crabro]
MASKTHLDSTVNERRLRPIYDSLDNGNNKQALQEADKVLRKQPGNQCARVLKALALLRLGKENECHAIMDKVRSEIPCEDSTLQAMSICYREINQPNKVSEVYEAAAKADPNNEELLTHLFMSYVRLGDYKKQQQTAFALYKLKPKNPYYFWAVMSIVMQAVRADKKLANEVILPLAERMVLKFVKQGKIEAEQEVQLYLMILELQGKSEKMLEVLSGPLASHLSSVPQRKAALLMKLEQFSEAADTYKLLIKGNSVDNWEYYQDYLSAALKFQEPSECLNFLNEIISTSERKVRGPYLARFELLKRIGESDNNNLMDCVDFMCQYFEKFGEKSCIAGDLRLYLHLLTPAGKEQLLNKITENVGVSPDGYPSTVEQMQRHIHLEQLRRMCGYHHSPLADINERKYLIRRLCDLYEKGNELCPMTDRLPTDFCPTDSYVLLATYLLHQLWCETNEASFLYGAMSLLERGLFSSPANFHIKILLVRTYLEAGLVGSADNAFTLLDIKHIQLDSLGYLHVPLLAPLGHLSLASTTLDHSTKFFIANYKDSADYLTFAYKYGSFTKIQEFMELREHLENSLHFAVTTIDKMLLDLSCCDNFKSLFSALTSMHIQPHEDRIRWDQLRDNRDLEVVREWEPLSENGEDPRKREETCVCMLRLLAARNLILRILAATAEPNPSLLFCLSTDLQQLDNDLIPEILQKFNIDEKRDKPYGVLVPLDAVERLREAHYSEQLKTIARFAEFLGQSFSLYNDCIEMLKNSLCLQPLCLPEHNNPISYKNILLRVSTCSETLAIISAMCISYISRFQPITSNRKNKKNESHESWREIAVFLTEKVRHLDAALKQLEMYPFQTGLDGEDKICAMIIKQGQASLVQSCKSLKSRSQLTLKLLSSLKS